ncbi:MAG: Uma2 family endonuclease [Scytonema sp. RU_4_4]|nr:Uma2 family endonuclease [Scytonema sp. RU_4_4]NJR74511.1 Uma2 family endonuclease [Scytonema sp. CRU_2_7]
MSVAKDQTTAPDTQEQEWDDIIFPPGDLYSNEPPLETDLHREQIDLLISLLKWWWRNRQDFYVSGNLTIYFSPNKRKSSDFRGPDFFVVLGTERKPRKSWVIWEEEGKYPNVIVELLSPSTADTDRGLKKKIYQDTFRTFDYFWFDPETLEFAGFHLVEGKYQALEPNSEGWLWSQQLELFLGIHQQQLRFFSADGQLIPTPEEAAAEAEALLARYRERFGELPQS